jgi:hypothetical protein
MARQIIVLETRKAVDGVTNVTGVNWFAIAAANARVPRNGYVSAASGLTGAKAITPAEQTALEDGSVREESFAVQLAASTTNAQIQAELVRRYTDRAAAIAAEPPTRQFYGASWDGSVWTP